MRTLVKESVNLRVVGHLVAAIFAMSIACCGLAQETAGWAGAKITQTSLSTGDTNYGHFSASSMTRAGCHVAKVEGERGKELWVRRDGQRGKAYADIAHPEFSPDGSALGYAARGAGGLRFIINNQEGPIFDRVMPDTFVSAMTANVMRIWRQRLGYLSRLLTEFRNLTLVVTWFPGFSLPCSARMDAVWVIWRVLERQKKMRVIVNGKPGEVFDGVGLRSLELSPDGRRFAYGANDRSTGDSWFRVIDGRRGKAFDALGVSFVFSPDGKRFAYTASKGQQWFLVVDGEPQVPIEGIVDDSVVFSPDSRRLAYAVAKADRRAYLVVDGKAGPVHDGIGASLPPGIAVNRASMQTGYGLGYAASVLFSPDSRRIAYLAHFGRMKRVISTARPRKSKWSFCKGGWCSATIPKRLAYGGRRLNGFIDKFFLVVDGKKGADYDALGYFGFSHDGKHIAFMAKKGNKMVIVVDGQERAEYSAVPAGPVFRFDGVLEFLAGDKPYLYRFEVRDL